MKNILLAVTLTFLLLEAAVAGKVLDAIKKAFEQKFPGATHVKWDKESATEYEADFKWNNLNYSANFNEQGELLETEMEFEFNQLPDKVKSAFIAANPDSKVKEVAKIISASGNIKFEIEFKHDKIKRELYYTHEGIETK